MQTIAKKTLLPVKMANSALSEGKGLYMVKYVAPLQPALSTKDNI